MAENREEILEWEKEQNPEVEPETVLPEDGQPGWEENPEQEQAGDNAPGEQPATAAASPEEQGEISLQEVLAQREAQVQELFGRLQRLQADFENFRRRVRREQEELGRYAAEQVLKQLLPVVDNLERALAAAAQEETPLRSGVEMIWRQLEEVLKGEGLSTIPAQGLPFDPNLHHAVLQEESPEEEGMVLAELQRGYRLGDKVLRPALVKVAKIREN